MVKVGSTYNVNADIVVVSVQKVPVKEGSLYRYSVAIMGGFNFPPANCSENT